MPNPLIFPNCYPFRRLTHPYPQPFSIYQKLPCTGIGVEGTEFGLEPPHLKVDGDVKEPKDAKSREHRSQSSIVLMKQIIHSCLPISVRIDQSGTDRYLDGGTPVWANRERGTDFYVRKRWGWGKII